MATSNLSFGTIGGLMSPVDAEAPLSLTCSNGGSYAVALDGGQSAATDPTQRRMTKSGNVLFYGLYRDSARQQPWGSDTGINTRTGTGTGLTQSLSVYGRIPVQAMAPPGTYQDVIVATVSY
jgi:spore coat protein U-like protein